MSKLVKLNVGGTKYVTWDSTILKYPESTLGKYIQNPQVQETKIDVGEEIFIDRDGATFKYIMGYLRDGDSSVLPNGDLPGDLAMLMQLRLEAQFFQLDGLEAIIERNLQALTQGGWKIGDIVTSKDLAHCLWIGNVIYETDRTTDPLGTIIQFRTDGAVAVRFEYMYLDKKHNRVVSVMLLVRMKPKQA